MGKSLCTVGSKEQYTEYERRQMNRVGLILFGAVMITVCLVASSFVARASAGVMTFKITPGTPNEVKFTSKAPLETVVGKTDQISGTLSTDPDNIISSSAAQFEVQMATLRTGIGKRDSDMRNNHLHTDSIPTSSFTLESLEGISNGKLSNGSPVNFRAEGKFTLHGVTRNIEPDITAIWNAAEKSIKVTARFKVLLQDYAIPRPQFLFMKLSEEQLVEINFTAIASE